MQLILFMNAFQVSDRDEFPRDNARFQKIFDVLQTLQVAYSAVSKSPAYCLELRSEDS
jgi:hypothetical protein